MYSNRNVSTLFERVSIWFDNSVLTIFNVLQFGLTILKFRGGGGGGGRGDFSKISINLSKI